jgi:acetyl esterase
MEVSMASKYPMHKDFRMVPSMNMRFSRVPVAVVNAVSRLIRFFQFKQRPDVEVQDLNIPGGKNGVKLKVFRPTANPENRQHACLVYFHGGAFFLTYLGMHLNSAAKYAARLDAVIVFLEYTLDTFPAGFNDCYDATMWVRDHADTLGIDANRLLVGGDSAGGNLAATVAQKAFDENTVSFLGQLLIYPVTDRSCSSESVEKFVDVPVWTGVSNKRMWKKYLENYSSVSIPPYAAAADREDLHGLAPAYVELAEFDPLHDEGLEYAKRLANHGVEVEINDTKGTVHGYDGLAPRNSISVDAMNRRIAFMERCLRAR